MFCNEIPRVKLSALNKYASLLVCKAKAKDNPTANPSGILCSVKAENSLMQDTFFTAFPWWISIKRKIEKGFYESIFYSGL